MWENLALFTGTGMGVRSQLQDLAVLFCVKTSVDSANSAIRMAKWGEAGLLASLAASFFYVG